MGRKNCLGCDYIEIYEEEGMTITTCLLSKLSRSNPSRHKDISILKSCPKDIIYGRKRKSV